MGRSPGRDRVKEHLSGLCLHAHITHVDRCTPYIPHGHLSTREGLTAGDAGMETQEQRKIVEEYYK